MDDSYSIPITSSLLNRGALRAEEVERCKQEELQEEMTGEFPPLSRVFVQERDLCLADSLQFAAAHLNDETTKSDPEVEQLMKLPYTISQLSSKDSVIVFLVGTAHFSLEIQEDVAKITLMTRPRFDVVELCFCRLNILRLDEKTILEEARIKSYQDALYFLFSALHGSFRLIQGALYFFFTSAHLSRQLRMAPGGEFHRAYHASRNVQGCRIHLGDRPIHVILHRALAALSLWQKVKLVWDLLLKPGAIRVKEVDDADAASEARSNFQGNEPPTVVGVVVIGHIARISLYFEKVSISDVRKVMSIPPQTMASRIQLSHSNFLSCTLYFFCFCTQSKSDKLEFNDNSIPLDPSLCDSVKQVKEQLLKGKVQGSKSFPFKFVHGINSGKVYGTEPKCIRVKEIYTLLYFVVYGYDGELISDQLQARELLRTQNPVLDGLDCEMFDDLPDIYKTKLGWQTFIEPLPVHSGWPTGWAFLCDILLRLPLSIFLKVVNITYQIEGLEAYIKHPIKQYVLLKHLPLDLRQGLIFARKYIFSVHEIITNMVYLGLAQFGPTHSLKEKDQVFIYLNRKTTLMDTTPSNPGYHHISRDIEYEKKSFILDSMEDVDKYWYEVWTICSSTLFGSLSTVTGQSITLEMLRKKPAMIEAMRMREPHEAPTLDTGEVPGDHLGATGFDSAFFAHLKRNWTYNKSTTKATKSPHTKTSNPSTAPGRLASLRNNVVRFTQSITQDGTNLTIPVTVVENETSSRNLKRKRRDSNNSTPTVRWSNVAKKAKVSTKPASKVRVVKARKKKGPRRPNYDEKDREALLLMRRLRVTWSDMEDSFLLVCKLAGTYIHGCLRQSVPFVVIRDCLHERFPQSRNKTSRVCQRRVAYMMRNDETRLKIEIEYQALKEEPNIEEVSGVGPITIKDRNQGVEKTEELIISRFRKLLEYLTPRFSPGVSFSSYPNIKLPNTIEEFHQQYELKHLIVNLRHREPILEVKDVVKVNSNVVYNVIHSSLCTTEDKASWGFHLFNIYQQYPDSLVRSALAEMKSDMMIAQRKRAASLIRSKKFPYMPLSAVPYKLSITYIHLFLSRYQNPIFHSSHQRLQSILAEKQKNDLDRQENWSGVEVSLIHEEGNAAMAVSLFSIGIARFHFAIPDQIIIFDPKLKDHPEEFDNLIKRFNNWVKDVYTAAKKRKNVNKEDSAQIQRRRLGMTTAAASSAIAAIPKLISTTDVAASRNHEELVQPTPSNVSEAVTGTNSDRTQNHLANRPSYATRRSPISKQPIDTSQAHIQQEHFVINSCKVYVDVSLPESASEGWLFISPKKKQEILVSIPTTVPFTNSLPDQAYEQLYERLNCSQSAKDDSATILQLITSKKEMGIIVSELPHIVGDLDDPSFTLEKHMSLLTESRANSWCSCSVFRFNR
uniref:Uncharacterized protein n=1 Tax=Daphnia galeata TaxID=27404 RepID=A0A8J2WK66_9CRUS|nr:unnamed protein product [Daphnia galeata]